MAKFNCIPPFTGTIGPICIYQMYGRYFLRTRSSLTGERVKKDPAFRKTMEYADLLGKASRIGSVVYAALPAQRKQHALYRKLTGEAMAWLKLQWTEKDVLEYLMKQYVLPVAIITHNESEANEIQETLQQTTRRKKRERRKIAATEVVASPKHHKRLLEWQQLVREYKRQFKE